MQAGTNRMERAVALRQQVTCQLEEEEQRISWETEWRAHTKAEALQAKNSAQAEVPAPCSPLHAFEGVCPKGICPRKVSAPHPTIVTSGC